jgi:hypothetical protein
MTRYNQGDRVMTPYGSGSVQYIRLCPPDFRDVQVVSVYLDDKSTDRRYYGTLFSPNEVNLIE